MNRIVSITRQLVEELREIQREEALIPNCLIVEDDDNDAELSRIALEAMGAKVHRVKTGDEAIKILDASQDPDRPDYHIVFLDLNLIGSSHMGTGYHVLKHVREKFKKLHVVIVSGYIDEGLINFITRDPGGYIGIIQKPLERADVKEIFAKHNLNNGHGPAQQRPQA